MAPRWSIRRDCRAGRIKATAVANFQARIAQDILLDDGEQQHREFGIVAELGAQKQSSILRARGGVRQNVGWVLQKLGPQAIIYPGQQQHARAAIQWLSDDIQAGANLHASGVEKARSAEWVGLHAAGALGSGERAGFGNSGEALRTALHLSIESDHPRSPMTVPKPSARVYAFSMSPPSGLPFRSWPVFTAPRWEVRVLASFSLVQAAYSRCALAALCQQHFGAAIWRQPGCQPTSHPRRMPWSRQHSTQRMPCWCSRRFCAGLRCKVTAS